MPHVTMQVTKAMPTRKNRNKIQKTEICTTTIITPISQPHKPDKFQARQYPIQTHNVCCLFKIRPHISPKCEPLALATLSGFYLAYLTTTMETAVSVSGLKANVTLIINVTLSHLDSVCSIHLQTITSVTN